MDKISYLCFVFSDYEEYCLANIILPFVLVRNKVGEHAFSFRREGKHLYSSRERGY